MTTKRRGSTPSDSESSPAASTSSCTTLRSKAVIGVRGLRSPVLRTSSIASLASVDQRGAPLGAVAGDVEHQPAALTGGRLHRESGQLLQRVEHLPVLAHQAPRHPAVLGVDDRHRRAVTVDVDVDVTVEVADVEERLEEVGRHLALALELGPAVARVGAGARRRADVGVLGASSSIASRLVDLRRSSRSTRLVDGVGVRLAVSVRHVVLR